MTKSKKILASALSLALIYGIPLSVFAQNTFKGLVSRLTGYVNPIIVLLTGVALVVFLYGVVKFIYSAGSDDARKEAKNRIVFGVVALFVLVSVWGLVRFVQITFFGPGTPPGGSIFQ